MQVIRENCDEVVVIDAGAIVESSVIWRVFSRPQQTITQELLDLEQLNLLFDVHSGFHATDTHTVLKLYYEARLNQPHDLSQVFASSIIQCNYYKAMLIISKVIWWAYQCLGYNTPN